MGCDYYIVTELQIEYKDCRSKHIRLNSERHWWFASCPKYDSDDPKHVRDAAEKQYEEECEKELDKYNKEILLYENGVWFTDNQENIQFYIEKLGIINHVAKIVKIVYAYK